MFFCRLYPRPSFFIKPEQYVCNLRKQIVAFHCVIIKAVCVLDVITDVFVYVESLVFNTPASTSGIRKFAGVSQIYRKVCQPPERTGKRKRVIHSGLTGSQWYKTASLCLKSKPLGRKFVNPFFGFDIGEMWDGYFSRGREIRA